ncbi:MAG TPA: hypothetical protein DEG06_01695 [Lachnospiraceae bacterium]|nr:hypothetical protein [Lachnospiraceae bacterium]HBY70930.1 hypothetical protein [Lachnospiraceae bacterium]HCA70052.1 hypothetical protein [Lachnospiraceae bacterium]HCM13917.1 hypothetical protein [Lachnospiraceae bacterium]HCR41032.1 hypothetical protein [Lachnospiraceae bacterium]
MVAFIKDYNLDSIKKKLILLYLLNVIDIFMTLLLLRTGLFREVNFIMAKLVEIPFASLLFKIIFPAFILYYLYTEIKKTAKSEDQKPAQVYQELKISNISINLSILIYVIVDLTHLIWTALLPYIYTIA